ncbi:hypothetical protein ASF49_21335 [Methylobacterium sp. Leaf104]|nr:hypothetical protein ASF49_21335 [Methylobacterium sp. Leaf104]
MSAIVSEMSIDRSVMTTSQGADAVLLDQPVPQSGALLVSVLSGWWGGPPSMAITSRPVVLADFGLLMLLTGRPRVRS